MVIIKVTLEVEFVKMIRVICLLLSIWGFSCLWVNPLASAQTMPQHTGKVAVYPRNPHYLQDAAGNPVVLIGFGNEQKNRSTVLDQLSGKINYQRAFADWSGRKEDPNAYERGRPWPMVGGKADMDVWNETYWANLRSYIEDARDRGIVVGLTIWDGHYGLPGGRAGADSVWQSKYNIQNIQWAYNREALVNYRNPRPTGGDAERLVYYQRRWIDRLISEIKAYPNVIIELNNEDPLQESWFLWWAQYFKDRGDFVIAVNGGAVRESTFASSPLLDMWSVHKRTDRSITPARYAWNKVIVADADDQCDNLDATRARKIAWRSFLKGGHWNDFVCSDTVGFPDSTKTQYYGHLLSFIKTRAVPFAEMSPNPSLVSTGTVLAEPGFYYLAYVEGRVNLDLSAVSGILDYEWYNPRIGITIASGQVQGGAVRAFSPPGLGDFVLWVRKRSAERLANLALR